MLEFEQLHGPFTYQWYWLVLLAALAVGVYLLRQLVNRRAQRKPKPIPIYLPIPPEIKKPPLPALKQYTVQAIDRVVTEHQSGELSLRQAYQQLSGILKEFAWRSTGEDIRTLTLAELKMTRYQSLAKVIEEYYPVAFSADERKAITTGARLAKDLVGRWK